MAAEFALLSTSLLVVTKLPVPLLIYASAVLPSILFRSASTSMLQTRWLSDLLVQRLQRMWRGSWPMWPLCRLWVGWFLRREACQNTLKCSPGRVIKNCSPCRVARLKVIGHRQRRTLMREWRQSMKLEALGCKYKVCVGMGRQCFATSMGNARLSLMDSAFAHRVGGHRTRVKTSLTMPICHFPFPFGRLC